MSTTATARHRTGTTYRRTLPTTTLRTGILALGTGLALAACGATPDPAGASGSEETTTDTATDDTAVSTPGEIVDEIPAQPGDGVNDRLLPDENLLGRVGWALTGQSADLPQPLYRNPCSPDSAIEEYSAPISNITRTWQVSGYNVPELPAPPGVIGVDLYGYESPERAEQALSAYVATLESCPDPEEEIIGDLQTPELGADGPYPVDQGVQVGFYIPALHQGNVIIARMGQILIVTSYATSPASNTGDLDMGSLAQSLLTSTAEVIGESY